MSTATLTACHDFVDDGSGLSCDECGMPRRHPRHAAPEPVTAAPTHAPAPARPQPTVRHVPEAPVIGPTPVLGAWPRTGSQRARVLEAVIDAGIFGVTDDEAGAALGLIGSSVRPRRGELVEAGWVEPARDAHGVPITRRSTLGNPATVYVLSARARAHMVRTRTAAAR